MILEFSLIAFLILIGVYVIRTSYKSRSAKLEPEQKELVLKGLRTKISPFLNLSILALLYFTGDYDKTLGLVVLIAFALGISIVVIELAFQLLINKDRLLIGPDNLVFRSVHTIELDWRSINKIRLNGVTSIISIYGNKTIRFNKNRISRVELDELFEEIAIRTGFENIELTDNLKERKTAGNNG